MLLLEIRGDVLMLLGVGIVALGTMRLGYWFTILTCDEMLMRIVTIYLVYSPTLRFETGYQLTSLFNPIYYSKSLYISLEWYYKTIHMFWYLIDRILMSVT